MSIFSHHSRRSSSRGFTIIEMLVVMAIMAIITIVFLVRQNRFDSSTILRSLAYSVALSVRQAQVYGTSVLGTTTSSGTCTGGFYNNNQCYASAYGLYFDSANLSSYVLFSDLNNDGQYQSNEAIKTFQMGTGYSLNGFGATVAGSGLNLLYLQGGSSNTITNLSIVFKRPNPDACIATSHAPDACQTGASPIETYSSAYIRVQSDYDAANTKSIGVSTMGEVSVCTTVGC